MAIKDSNGLFESLNKNDSFTFTSGQSASEILSGLAAPIYQYPP